MRANQTATLFNIGGAMDRLASELPWIEEKPLHFVEIKTDIVLMHNPVFYEHDD